MTVKDLARESPIARLTWRAWIRQGRLPHVRLGRRVFVTRSDYERFIAAGRVEARREVPR